MQVILAYLRTVRLARPPLHDLSHPGCAPVRISASICMFKFTASTLFGLAPRATARSCASSVSFTREEHFRQSQRRLSFLSDFPQVLLDFQWTSTLMAIDNTEFHALSRGHHRDLPILFIRRIRCRLASSSPVLDFITCAQAYCPSCESLMRTTRRRDFVAVGPQKSVVHQRTVVAGTQI
jgi:hypothetical protein